MNDNNNIAIIFRSLIVYAVCVTLAIIVGYTLTNPLDYQTMGFYGILVMLLLTPILLRWHYPLLLLSWNMGIFVFFLPSRPYIWLPMLMLSLGISVLERIMSNDRHFIRAPQITWPLLAFLAVIYFTAELTGGFGFRSLGATEVYGGKKYIYLIAGIMSYFALTARPVPLEKAKWYVALLFLGSLPDILGDFIGMMPAPFSYIGLFIPASGYTQDEKGEYSFEFGETRLGGVSITAASMVYMMLALYGLRGIFLSGKIGRPFLFLLAFTLTFLGGARSTVLLVVLVIALQFFMEKLHRSKLMLPSLFIGIIGVVLIIPFAHQLPRTFQRSLAVLPLDIDPQVRIDADGSSQWRLNIWMALLPEVPQHLLLGKGFGISATTLDSVGGADTPFRTVIDEAQNPLAISGDYHSGPFSVVLTFGIWGTLVVLWFWGASLRVLYQNCKYGNPALRTINLLLFSYFAVKILIFVFIFGAISSDMAVFAGLIGLSVALNHGVCRPPPRPALVTRPRLMANRFAQPQPAIPS